MILIKFTLKWDDDFLQSYKSLFMCHSEVLANLYIHGLKGIGVGNENAPDIGVVYSKILLKLFCH